MFTPKDKSAKEAALKKLMDLMDKGDHEDLKGLGKPSITAIDVKPVEDDDSLEDISEGEEEPSDEDKQKIKDLYEKYCR